MHTTHSIDWDTSGWTSDRGPDLERLSRSGLEPGRIIGQFGREYETICPRGALRAAISGAYGRLIDLGIRERPVIGDYVGVSPEGRIEELLVRTSEFARLKPGTVSTAQTMVANLDLLVVVTAADSDLSPNRMERFLENLRGDAESLAVINKTDLAENRDALLSDVSSRLPYSNVAGVSALTGAGFDVFAPWLVPGKTLAFLGSSGVGKSSIIRRLTARTDISVAEIRADGKGRHTTSDRRIYRGPAGCLLVDLPGVREVGLQGDGAGTAFPDLDHLAAECKYRDCTHRNEPGCALRKAVDAGNLELGRLENYLALLREADSTTEAVRARKKAREKQIGKAIRDFRKPGRDTR